MSTPTVFNAAILSILLISTASSLVSSTFICSCSIIFENILCSTRVLHVLPRVQHIDLTQNVYKHREILLGQFEIALAHCDYPWLQRVYLTKCFVFNLSFLARLQFNIRFLMSSQ